MIMSASTIDDLPDEILEYIFLLLPPYEDVRCCMIVNKKWHEIAKHVIPRIKHSFNEALSIQNVTWETSCTVQNSITKRYAHSACRYHDYMYVFGGFTSSFSSFNDLWKLNLSSKTWSRISVEGRCPVPKAGATMVTYEDKLVLFGGLLPPMHGVSYQNRRLSNHIHVYDIPTNRWNEIEISDHVMVPGLAGHSATIHKNKMIIFGGLEKRVSVNDVYSLNLSDMSWIEEKISGEKPVPRYGHSQVLVDSDHLLILGGVNNEPLLVLDDAWLLDMSNNSWYWRKIDLGIHAPLMKTVWCHPVCKVDKYILVFKPTSGNPRMYADWFPVPFPRCSSAIRTIKPQEVNLNGKRGILSRASSHDNLLEKNQLKKCGSSRGMRDFVPSNTLKSSVIEMHAINTSLLLTEGRLSSVRNKFRPLNCPTDTILYTVIEGNGELIMFGGIQRDVINYEDGTEEIEIQIMNTLRVIKVKRKII